MDAKGWGLGGGQQGCCLEADIKVALEQGAHAAAGAHRLEREVVWLHPRRRHAPHDLRGPLRVVVLGAALQQRVEGDCGRGAGAGGAVVNWQPATRAASLSPAVPMKAAPPMCTAAYHLADWPPATCARTHLCWA